MADVTRNANVHWEGDVRRGSGNIDLASSGAGGSLPTRSSDDASGQTSPEELIAASHAGLAPCAVVGTALALVVVRALLAGAVVGLRLDLLAPRAVTVLGLVS